MKVPMYLELINPQEADRRMLASVMDDAKVLFVEEYAKSRDVKKAALVAGYTEEEGGKILQDRPRWFVSAYRLLTRDLRVEVLEEKMDEILNLPLYDEDGKLNSDVLNAQKDLVKYGTSTLIHDTYSTKTENRNTNITVNISEKLSELEKLNQSNVNGRRQEEIGEQIVEVIEPVQDN